MAGGAPPPAPSLSRRGSSLQSNNLHVPTLRWVESVAMTAARQAGDDEAAGLAAVMDALAELLPPDAPAGAVWVPHR